MSDKPEQHEFQADVSQVLSIVINSLYSHKEIFLRELISNASDASDRRAFLALTDHDLADPSGELKIQLVIDKDDNTLTIRDYGVGMSKEDLTENLGTVARSGSKKLMEALSGEQKDDLSLIGQFGVGFYSGFLVAERVTVVSRAVGSTDAWRWESDGQEGFRLEPTSREWCGTDITLHLREESKEYLDEWRLRQLVTKYSDYVRYPIQLPAKAAAGEGESDDGATEDGWETVNTARALWTRPKSEIEDDQYDEFYKHLSHDWQAPLARTHFKVEGTQEMTGLLFVPSQAPFDLFEPKRRGVRLFVKRVFIMDDCEELLPEWLRFVRGVVDSADLPLNVSRELLQQDRATRFLRKQIVSKTLSLLEELAEEGETEREIPASGDEEARTEKVDRYDSFWREFGRVLKEGVHHDQENRERIAKLLRYPSSHQDEGFTTLQDYVGRMKEDQPGIFFVTADSVDAARGSPHSEGLVERGYEVLYMADPIDEWVTQSLPEFDGKKLIAASKGALDLPETDDEKKAREEKAGEFESLTTKVQEHLDEHVKEVRITDRLTESPACLVTDDHGIPPHLERLLRANGRDVPQQKRILELNPDHAIVVAMRAMCDGERQAELGEWTDLLYQQALLAEGSMPEDPARFARSIAKLMQNAAGGGA